MTIFNRCQPSLFSDNLHFSTWLKCSHTFHTFQQPSTLFAFVYLCLPLLKFGKLTHLCTNFVLVLGIFIFCKRRIEKKLQSTSLWTWELPYLTLYGFFSNSTQNLNFIGRSRMCLCFLSITIRTKAKITRNKLCQA